MRPGIKSRSRPFGFTLLELMLSIAIFSMVLTAIYAIWHFIVRGTMVGIEAAAEIQRSRMAMRALEDAFTTSVMFTANIKNYAFLADTSGDMASVSLVSRLPASFPGVGRYGDQIVRRVVFEVHAGRNGDELVMAQAPMMQDTEQVEPYSLVLARDVNRFQLEFWDLQKAEWLDEWSDTNQMPRMVKISLGLGRSGSGSGSQDLNVRLVSIPSAAVPGDIQGAGGPAPGVLNRQVLQ